MKKAALWIVATVFFAYAYSLFGGFHFDDSHSVETNIAIRSLSNILSFWTDPRTSSFIPENRVYRPLVYTFYSFCWLIGQGSTWPFHVMKLMMHSSVCIALFLIWRRLWSVDGWFPVKSLKIRFPFLSQAIQVTPGWAALLLALLFAVHPAGSECVDYISATTSLQCAMFYLWAFWAYLQHRDLASKKLPSGRALATSLFCYFLSVASKEEGITLPAMVLVTELFLLSGSFQSRVWPALRRMIPYAFMGIALAAWIFAMHPESGNESRGMSTWQSYFMTQWRAYLWYMRLWFWPWDLNADYATMEFSQSIFDAAVIQAVIGNGLLIAFAWLNRKRFPAMLYGLLWFYITISPASSVIRLAEAINEHRMYLAYAGFVGGTFAVLLFCAENFFAAEKRPQRVGWIYALAFVGLFAGTQERNRVWADDENLWSDTVVKNPTSGRALNNLALVYLQRGEFQKAVEYFERCEQYWSSYMYCPLNRGIALRGLGQNAERTASREPAWSMSPSVSMLSTASAVVVSNEAKSFYDRAESAFMRSFQLNPRSVHANYHLAQFYQDVRKDCSKATEHYRLAVEVTGGRNPAAEARMAGCLTTLNRPKEAVSVLEHALEVDPGNEIALFEKGRAELELHDPRSAVKSYELLVRQNPRHLQGWYNWGVSALSLNDFETARRAFIQTLELEPNNKQALYNLSAVAERLGDGHQAAQAIERLIQLDPASPELKTRLDVLRKHFGATL